MEQTNKKSTCGIFDHNVQTENVKISELQQIQLDQGMKLSQDTEEKQPANGQA